MPGDSIFPLRLQRTALRQTSRAGAGKPIFTPYSSSDGDLRSAMLGSFSAPIQISGHLANISHKLGGP